MNFSGMGTATSSLPSSLSFFSMKSQGYPGITDSFTQFSDCTDATNAILDRLAVCRRWSNRDRCVRFREVREIVSRNPFFVCCNNNPKESTDVRPIYCPFQCFVLVGCGTPYSFQRCRFSVHRFALLSSAPLKATAACFASGKQE